MTGLSFGTQKSVDNSEVVVLRGFTVVRISLTLRAVIAENLPRTDYEPENLR